jgi:hypothetical protein
MVIVAHFSLLLYDWLMRAVAVPASFDVIRQIVEVSTDLHKWLRYLHG